MSDLVVRYRAATIAGALESGALRAPSSEAARAALAERGLFPLELRESEGGARQRVSAADLAAGLAVLGDLLAAGLPLNRSIASLEELAPRSWQPSISAMQQAVREGSTFAAALAAAPLEVPPVVCGLIAAGEAAGALAPSLARAAALMQHAAETRRALYDALAYPLLLSLAGAASVGLLVSFVLPRFAAILSDMGQELPASARLVLGAADLIRTAWLPALVVGVAGGVAWRAWIATDGGRRLWHAGLLELPLAGSIRRSAAVARFATALGALLDSGVSVAAALTHAIPAYGDAELMARARAAREQVLGGSGLAAALQATGAATPTTVRLIRAGEETGRLAPMLEQAGRIETAAAGAALRAAVRGVEPAMILAFGAVVALVAAALLQSVYSIRPVP